MANYLLADYEAVIDMNPQFKYRRRTHDGRIILTLRDGMNLRNVNVQVVTENRLREILEATLETSESNIDSADQKEIGAEVSENVEAGGENVDLNAGDGNDSGTEGGDGENVSEGVDEVTPENGDNDSDDGGGDDNDDDDNNNSKTEE